MIALPVENFDAEKVVITADHGELFGECGGYGHPAGFPHPNPRKVHWVTTGAEDARTVAPDVGEKTGKARSQSKSNCVSSVICDEYVTGHRLDPAELGPSRRFLSK